VVKLTDLFAAAAAMEFSRCLAWTCAPVKRLMKGGTRGRQFNPGENNLGPVLLA